MTHAPETDSPLAKHLPTVATSEAAIAADAPFAVALLRRCGAMDLAPMLGVA